jgi:hypothetical protein
MHTVGQLDIFKPVHGGDTFLFGVWGRSYYLPQKSPWSLPVFRHTTRHRRTSSDVMMSTLSTKEDGKQLSKMHSTARRSSATTSDLCIVDSSRWMICYSSAYFPMKACTSSPLLGGSFLGDTILPAWMRLPD